MYPRLRPSSGLGNAVSGMTNTSDVTGPKSRACCRREGHRAMRSPVSSAGERGPHRDTPRPAVISDFKDVATSGGLSLWRFVLDGFSPRIVGWRASASLRTDLDLAPS